MFQRKHAQEPLSEARTPAAATLARSAPVRRRQQGCDAWAQDYLLHHLALLLLAQELQVAQRRLGELEARHGGRLVADGGRGGRCQGRGSVRQQQVFARTQGL